MRNQNGVVAVRIRKGDTVFHVHGQDGGKEGVSLAMGQVHNIYDAPVKTTYKSGAFQEGSRYRARKWLHRDITLGFHITETDDLYELNESDFRFIFEYETDPWDLDPQPTTIEVETTLSGVRKLDVFMYEQPEFDAEVDPLQQQYGNLILKLRAPQPFWYQDDAISTFTSTSTSANGVVVAENPTDIVCYHKFIITRANWTLPDQQWIGRKGFREPGGPNAQRAIHDVDIRDLNGGAVVDTDRQELMFRDANDTNLLGQLAGRFFNYAIPPYTPATDLPVGYENAPTGGAMVQLVMPRRWSRPWGMELPPSELHAPRLTSFSTAGAYSYTIPDFADAVDVILLGGGGGGTGTIMQPEILAAVGGSAGTWTTATLLRGDDIPWETTTITGVIGAGGQAQKGLTVAAGDGGQTTATADGMTDLSAEGGTAGGNTGHLSGEGSGDETFNGKTYVGSHDQTMPGVNGFIPGGGGSGGWFWGPAGAGASGKVWFRAYQIEGS